MKGEVRAVLQACETAYDCGRRQVCHGGHCSCPMMYGLTGMPDCHDWSAGAYYSAAILVSVTLAQLCLAYLHGLTLYNHLREGDISNSVYSSGAAANSKHEDRLAYYDQASFVQRLRRHLVMLTTRKSLFCLSSLAWLLLTVVNRVCIALMMLTDGPVGPLFAYPTSIFEYVFCFGFMFFAWSYLIIGRIWLDVASKFGGPNMRSSYWCSCAGRCAFLFCAMLIILPPIHYLSTPNELTRSLNSFYTAGTMGIFCTVCFAFGAAVMVRVICMRARQVKGAERPVAPRDRKRKLTGGNREETERPFRQVGAQIPHSKAQEERQRKMVLNVLKKARDRAFQPMLSHVSEADSAAVERSAATSVVGRSSRADREAAENHVTAKVAPTPVETVEVSEEDTMRRDAAAKYNALAWNIASTALKVGAAFALTLTLGVTESNIEAGSHDLWTSQAVGFLFMRLLAYPGVHFWSNLACLKIISKEAREITSSVWILVLAPFRFLWYLLCTAWFEDDAIDYDEGVLGMPDVEENGRAAA